MKRAILIFIIIILLCIIGFGGYKLFFEGNSGKWVHTDNKCIRESDNECLLINQNDFNVKLKYENSYINLYINDRIASSNIKSVNLLSDKFLYIDILPNGESAEEAFKIIDSDGSDIVDFSSIARFESVNSVEYNNGIFIVSSGLKDNDNSLFAVCSNNELNDIVSIVEKFEYSGNGKLGPGVEDSSKTLNDYLSFHNLNCEDVMIEAN